MDFGYTIFGGMIRRDEDGAVVFDNAEPSLLRPLNELARLHTQIDLLVREVVAKRLRVNGSADVPLPLVMDEEAFSRESRRRHELRAFDTLSEQATNANPDLQARIARDMESK